MLPIPASPARSSSAPPSASALAVDSPTESAARASSGVIAGSFAKFLVPRRTARRTSPKALSQPPGIPAFSAHIRVREISASFRSRFGEVSASGIPAFSSASLRSRSGEVSSAEAAPAEDTFSFAAWPNIPTSTQTTSQRAAFAIALTFPRPAAIFAAITAVRAGSEPQTPSAVTPLSEQKTAIARRPARRSAVPRMPAIRMTSRSSSPRLPTGFASASHRPFAAVSASLSISGIPPKFIGQLHGLLYVMSCLFVTAHSVQSISNSIMPERIPGNKMQFPSA